MLFGSDDADFVAVVVSLADEWNILETEQGPIVLQDIFSTAESLLGLPVEGTLAEDRAHEATVRKVVLDLVEDISLCVRGRANNHDIGARHDVFGFAGHLVDLADKFALALPVAALSNGLDAAAPDLRASGEHVDLPSGVHVANCGNRAMS